MQRTDSGGLSVLFLQKNAIFRKKCLHFGSDRAILTKGFAVKAEEIELTGKEVNKSNEGRYPSQLSADYDQMRLR